jgi:hypothetical protein
MRTALVLAAGAALAGCFDEGEQGGNTAAAETMADGLLAFPDIHNNIETDPGAAAVALLAFVKAPVAANNLVAPPFDLGTLNAARAEAPTPVPDCLTTSGPAGCDSFVTNSTCEAGNFTFSGNASRSCTPCANVTGTCTYDWALDLQYSSTAFTLTVHTTGPATVAASSVTYATTWDFTLVSGGHTTAGSMEIGSCGAATIDPGPPRRLVSSEFYVAALSPTGDYLGICAHVLWDASGNPSVRRGPNDDVVCECL